MEPEVLVRRAALVALPLLLLVGYLLRSRGPDERDDPKTRPLPVVSASPTGSSAPTPSTPTGSRALPEALFTPPSASVASVADEKKQASPPELPPPPPATPAARLPEASLEETPSPAPAAQGSPCGGLIVRLITMAEDPKFAFASMATGYADEAQIVHVGESIAGYRVTGIEWDRVWVQGAKGRCAVGMHLGVREAEAGVDQEAAAQDYAKLPWVLPHEITSGMFKRAEMDWEFTEAAISKLYERGADVFAGLRVRVAKDGEQVVGLELHDVRLDSFLERLGILSGDVLSKIAGEPVTSADDVSRLLEELRNESELVVDFVRRGENYQLKLRVVGLE